MSKAKKKPALGRGLGALLPNQAKGGNAKPTPAKAPAPSPAPDAAPRTGVQTLPIEQLEPNPEQPRKHFDPLKLDELASSIKTQGLLQPIVVSPQTKPGSAGVRKYLIIAGERRWRASQKAGLHEVPVVIRAIDEEDRLELGLVENIQRADLNPIEEALAYRELIRIREYTQEELAMRVGKDRSTIANALRLLRLPPRVQELVQVGTLSMGHARALLGLEHEDAINSVATEVVRGNFSVRATEAAVRKYNAAQKHEEPSDEDSRRKIIVGELETRLRRRLGARVKLKAKGKKGHGMIEIPYASLDELDRLLKMLLADGA
ncbi:MAG: ParB/RepB/Spo0J family partition protein [Nannocystaceae bacterium]|nr:ParB/RepB/Spo0J family partition protein [bacterium]